MSARAFADVVKRNGRATDYTRITRIELGDNGAGGYPSVTVDELVMFAAIFEVRPEMLLIPFVCATCNGRPNDGFTCNVCGAGAPDA
jgi:hypothetical protein